MKKSTIIIAVICFCVSVTFTGCMTTSSIKSSGPKPGPVRKAAPLHSLQGDVYDVNTGEKIGNISVQINDNQFSLDVSIGATQGKTFADGTFDFEPYEGTFSGQRADFNGVYLLRSGKGEDGLFAVVHDYNNAYQSIFEKEFSYNENLYLITVLPEDVYQLAFDKSSDNYNPVFTIHAAKPYIRTQGAIHVIE